MLTRHVLFASLCLGVLEVIAVAAPKPGDVFREYTWRPEGKWQRVTGPDTTEPRAREFLPNAINEVVIDDLHKAVRVEAYVEMLLCHAGTIDKRIRVNGQSWIPIPESELIPRDWGTGPPCTEYQSMRYPEVEIPLEQICEGKNTFEFTCSGGTRLGGWWPQWIVYGVTFRVYYSADKTHPTGRILSPASGATLKDALVTVEVEASGPRPVDRVEVVGLYTDFNWEGDGNDRQWHYRYLYGEIHNHVGTSPKGQLPIEWDTQWIPTQDASISLAAWIVDESGMVCVSPAVENLRLARRQTVRMVRPYEVPKAWSTRAGQTDEAKIDVIDDLSKAVDAKIVMSTWNGVAANEIGINGQKIVENVGKNHDQSYDEFAVPLEFIKQGANTVYTHSTTTHHGIEVQWPGMVLLLRLNEPEAAP
jgi:hypothetical protein